MKNKKSEKKSRSWTSVLAIGRARATDLVPPEPVLVVGREGVDHDGYGQGEDEDAGEGREAADQLAQEGLGAEVVAHRGDGHQPPPEGLHEGPGVDLAAGLVVALLLGEVDQAGEGQDGHRHQQHQQTKLLVRLGVFFQKKNYKYVFFVSLFVLRVLKITRRDF